MVKFRTREPGQAWGSTPPIWKYCFENAEQANAAARTLANFLGREVRWNWEGSYQGHYIGPDNALKKSKGKSYGGVKWETR